MVHQDAGDANSGRSVAEGPPGTRRVGKRLLGLVALLVSLLGLFLVVSTSLLGSEPPDAGTGAAPGVGVDDLRACFDQTHELNAAFLDFRRHVELTKDESRTFTVTLASTPLGQPGSADERLRVACTVSTRLVSSGSRLEVSPSDWVQQQYLPPEPSTWTWVVTGKASGETEAVLQVKPAIRLANSDGSTRVEDLRTEEFPVVFDTSTTWQQKVTSFWGVLIAAAGGIATLIGTWFLVRKLATGKDEEDDEETGRRAGLRGR
jgi:hypothetical protein